MEPQVKENACFRESYDSLNRFVSYWYEIHEINRLKQKSVLEIGIGNAFVSKYLKERGVNIFTLDIDEKLNPDIVGNVLDLPFPDNSFEIVACCQVLEHLPYKKFYKAISEIFRVSKSYAILSLPDTNWVYQLYIHIPRIRVFKKLIPIPRLKNPIHNFDGVHYWEIGKAGYSVNKILKDIKKVGFKLKKTYRIFENPYHRFFLLRKEK